MSMTFELCFCIIIVITHIGVVVIILISLTLLGLVYLCTLSELNVMSLEGWVYVWMKRLVLACQYIQLIALRSIEHLRNLKN
jgi:hypothetical protein